LGSIDTARARSQGARNSLLLVDQNMSVRMTRGLPRSTPGDPSCDAYGRPVRVDLEYSVPTRCSKCQHDVLTPTMNLCNDGSITPYECQACGALTACTLIGPKAPVERLTPMPAGIDAGHSDQAYEYAPTRGAKYDRAIELN